MSEQQSTEVSGHSGELAVHVARAHGVETMFTLSGAHVFPMYDGAVKAQQAGVEPPMRLLDVRHEQTAAFAAEATGKLTRVPGLAVLTAGPGVSLEHPLGIGPMVFSTIFPEDEHNIWLKSLTSYGWLGFLCYLTLVLWTLWAGFRNLLLDRPWQPFLMIAYIAFVGHTAIGFVIDTDHWRHFYLIVGIIWGCFALEHDHRRQQLAARRAP